VIAVPLVHFHPYLALGVIMLVTVIWILPTVGIGPRPDSKLSQ
jgi:hypothetical protein